jgi:DNA/RNA non-specific endonuclease
MSNIIPQNQENNSDIGRKRWCLGLEEFSRHLLEDGRELYIIAGTRETKTNLVSPQGFDINVPERLWKVVIVLDKPGQTIADVDENTMAFAIDLPNIDPEKDTAVNPTDWRDYVISVEELENYLALQNYNFLSNIPTETQKVIEERPKTEILQWINTNYPTSPLLAKSEENNLINKPTLDRIGTNSAIRHDSFVEDNSLRVSKTKFSSSGKIGITEVGIFEPGFANNSISKYGSTEIDIAKVALTERGITKINSFQTTSTETTVKKTGTTKFSEAHIALDKSTQLEIGIAEVGFSKNTFSIDFASPINSSKFTSSQIFFSTRESSDQFFIVHNQTPSSINTMA